MRQLGLRMLGSLIVLNNFAQNALAQQPTNAEPEPALGWAPDPYPRVPTNSTGNPVAAEALGGTVLGLAVLAVAAYFRENIANGCKTVGSTISNCCASLCGTKAERTPIANAVGNPGTTTTYVQIPAGPSK